VKVSVDDGNGVEGKGVADRGGMTNRATGMKEKFDETVSKEPSSGVSSTRAEPSSSARIE
jgi:hypothetical protein